MISKFRCGCKNTGYWANGKIQLLEEVTGLGVRVVSYISLFEEDPDGLVEPFIFGGGAGLLHLLIKALKTKETGNIAITKRNFEVTC